MQALLGVVSSNFRLVEITCLDQRIVVKVVLAAQCDEDLEEIDDLVSEFEALLDRNREVVVEVVFSEGPIVLGPPSPSRLTVFRRREQETVP